MEAVGVLGCLALLGLPLLNLIIVAWVARDAKSRGMDNPVLWMLLVFFTSIVGLFIYAIARTEGDLSACPFCGYKKLKLLPHCPHCRNATHEATYGPSAPVEDPPRRAGGPLPPLPPPSPTSRALVRITVGCSALVIVILLFTVLANLAEDRKAARKLAAKESATASQFPPRQRESAASKTVDPPVVRPKWLGNSNEAVDLVAIDSITDVEPWGRARLTLGCGKAGDPAIGVLVDDGLPLGEMVELSAEFASGTSTAFWLVDRDRSSSGRIFAMFSGDAANFLDQLRLSTLLVLKQTSEGLESSTFRVEGYEEAAADWLPESCPLRSGVFPGGDDSPRLSDDEHEEIAESPQRPQKPRSRHATRVPTTPPPPPPPPVITWEVGKVSGKLLSTEGGRTTISWSAPIENTGSATAEFVGALYVVDASGTEITSDIAVVRLQPGSSSRFTGRVSGESEALRGARFKLQVHHRPAS